ncbi:MAG: SPOR domain-containing protein [Candidatus Latescibacterota bacterium]|nr:MAG: SPOR domain-containing protein [Candidatus Latescibacterota bacterium]
MRELAGSFVFRTVVCAMGLCVVVIMGCTSAKKDPPAAKADTEPYRLESEGDVPPLPESQVRKEVDRVDTFEEMPVTDDGIDVQNVEPPPPPAKPAQKTMQGYRVQLLAAGSEASAQEVRAIAASKLGVSAYVDMVDGVYKVRVGDCPTREQAEALVERCRGAGYSDAWIVSCMILIPNATSAR